MRIIKAKDAKFGRFYEIERERRRCVIESSGLCNPGFANIDGLFIRLRDDEEITELPECDSFDWVPPAEIDEPNYGMADALMDVFGLKRSSPDDNPNGVRWYLDQEWVMIRGYGGEKELLIESDGSLSGNSCIEDRCIDAEDTVLSTAEVLCRLAQAGHTNAWNAARELTGLTEQEAYLAGQSVCGLSVGDRVRVTRKAASWEMGWAVAWSLHHKYSIVCEVVCVNEHGLLFKDRGGWRYPFFVLERVETLADEATPVESPAEIAPEIDPGEGWRLIDTSDPNEKPQEGDEYKGLKTGRWLPSWQWVEVKEFCEDLVYRRRIQPVADHGVKVGDWVKTPDHETLLKVTQVINEHQVCVQFLEGGGYIAGVKNIRKVTFRPFASAAEFEPFRDEWYRRKETNGKQSRPMTFGDRFVNGVPYATFLEKFEFVSGRPCGVEVGQ